MRAESNSRGASPLDGALKAVGDRWTLLVVAALLDGPRRFNDLQQEIPGLAPNILSRRLRHLESEGLIVAEPYSNRPPRSVYELTAAGRGLAGSVRLLTDWGARNVEGTEPPRHQACGTPMEARWYCSTCDRTVGEQDGDLDFV